MLRKIDRARIILLNFFASTDGVLMEGCGARAKLIRDITAISVITGGAVAGMSATYFGWSLAHNAFHAIVFGFLGSWTIIILDKSVMLADKMYAVLIRLVIIMLTSYIMSFPLKIAVMEKAVKAEVANEARKENAALYETIIKLEGRYASDKSSLEGEIRQIERQTTATKRLREAEVSGYVLRETQSTGLAGKGSKYKALTNDLAILQQAKQEKEDRLNELAIDYARDKAESESRYNSQKREVQYSFPYMLAAFQRLLNSDDPYKASAAHTIDLIFSLLLIVWESAPSILKLLIPSSQYYRLEKNFEHIDKRLGDKVTDYLSDEIEAVSEANTKEEYETLGTDREAKLEAFKKIRESQNSFFNKA